jgi:hypothetical protein
MRRRSHYLKNVSGAWLAEGLAGEPEPEPEPEVDCDAALTGKGKGKMGRRHEFLRMMCSRLAAAARASTGGDAMDRLLQDRDSALVIESFFTKAACSQLYVWLPPEDEDCRLNAEPSVFSDVIAAARNARATGLAVGLEPPGMYRAAICLFKPHGDVAVTEENVTRVISTVDLGGSATHSLERAHDQTGMAATLAQVSAVCRHLYFPVGAELLCPTKVLASAEGELAGGAGMTGISTTSDAVTWSDSWNVTATDAQVGEGARRQVAADFSRFIADLDVAAMYATESNEVCLPVPLSEEVTGPVEEKLLSDRVRMIERAVASWTTQCMTILEDESTHTAQSGPPMSLPGPRVEIERWHARRQRLVSVTNQLRGPQLQVCIEVLRAVQSTVYPEFRR